MEEKHPPQKLPPAALLAIGAAVFGMHFGASSMLWPATWGRDSGTAWLTAFSGYFFTGLLLPALGYIAVTRGGPLRELAGRVGARFGLVFGGFTFFILGPLFAIPRMSAAAWDAVTHAALPLLGQAAAVPPWWASGLFAILYYLVIYWFIHKQSEIVGKLSRLLVPGLFVLEIFLIASVIFYPPGAPVAPNYSRSPFGYGFISGYQTLDLPAALIFSGLIIADIKGRGLREKGPLMSALFKGVFIGFIVFGLVMFGEQFRGHLASGVFTETSYASLSVDIVMSQWGLAGGTLFNLALLLACIPSVVGLTAGLADFFASSTKGRISYRAGCIGTLALSCLITQFGLSSIILWVTPLLSLLYPPCIALALCTAFIPNKRGPLRGACYFSLAFGALEALHGYLGLLNLPDFLAPFLQAIPGAGDGLGFVPFMALGLLLGWARGDA